ncbi:hypothetical protein B0H11DRAFT_2188497 [Mycena galericulata]|nr:hypothetical protein B0H11DRAFT_2188497 [Mycena galericulata]
MAPPKPTELFRGNGTAEKAHTWLRTLEQTWKYNADKEEKMYHFEKGLHPGSQAEEWWNGLTAAEKLTWEALMVAFEKKWAKPTATRRSQDVIIAELANNSLDREALGKYVNDEDGVLVLSHIAWAEVTRGLLGELPSGDVGMMLKSSIRATLPVEFRHLIVDTGLDTWEKYLKAVEDVSVDRINDAVEERTSRDTKMDTDISTWHRANPNSTPAQREAQFEAFANKLATDLGLAHLLQSPSRLASPAIPRYVPPAARVSQPPSSPATRQVVTPSPRAYQTTPSTTLNTPRVPWASRASTDVFSGSTVRPYPNTFTKNLATPASPLANRGRPTTLSGDAARDVDLVRHIAQNPRMYATDAAGIQSYNADMATWMTQNGNSPTPDYATFPITPGTAAPGSRECFRCGILTDPPHFGTRACREQNGREVPMREQNVRGFVGAIMFPPGQRTPARVSQIHEVPYDLFGGLDPDQRLYEEEEESGNGEESAN